MTTLSRPAHAYVRDLQPAQRIAGTYSIANAQLGRTKTEKFYLRCLVGDRTGDMPARMWTIDPEQFKRLPTDGFAYLEGETQPYQGELQLIIHLIDPADPTPDQMRELLPASTRSADDMMAELRSLLETLRHPALKALAKVYLDDQPLMDAFRICPAAKSLHHAFLGGLLEHTLSVMKLADAVCPLYPKINRDIVLLGLFLHDLGKTRELVYDRTFSYTDRGELVGHLVEGAVMLHDRAQLVMRATGQRLPRHTLLVLQHIIISHHGVPEFGAAKVPATPEAILVSILDNLDAKMYIALAAARPDRTHAADLGGNFTEKVWGLDTKLFRPDPLTED